MTSPSEQFRESVESALNHLTERLDTIQFANVGKDAAGEAIDTAYAEALASIQASTVELLKGIRPAAFPDPLGGEAEWRMWGQHYVKEINQLIKDLSNGK